MTSSPRLNLPFVMPAQAQKHVTVNESLERLDAMVQASARSRTAAQQPPEPEPGDSYILPAGATGAQWDDYTPGSFVTYTDGGWAGLPAVTGARVWVADEAALLVFDGQVWTQVSGAADDLTQLGVNAGADKTNRLTVKSDAELLTHDDVTPGSGDARKVINKAAADRTASVVFQNGYSGRAEFGLIGDDDFTLKTSADGSNFENAMTLSAARDIAEIYHPLSVLGSPVLTADDKPVFSARVASAAYDYAHDEMMDLAASLDSHSGFDPVTNLYTVPHTGLYFVQIGLVIRSVSASVKIVKVRLYKNTSLGESVSAISADANITTVNDAGIVSLAAGDTINLRAQFNNTAGTGQFFSTTRMTLFRVV